MSWAKAKGTWQCVIQMKQIAPTINFDHTCLQRQGPRSLMTFARNSVKNLYHYNCITDQ